jgi:mono/diheme cytochrome c family protein
MKTVKLLSASLAILFVGMFLTSMTIDQQKMPEPWEVPAKYKNMENPVPADDQSLQLGERLYRKHCASCHGREGLGDGPKARTLETFSGDFSGEAYQSQTDGEHFYKTKFGRGEMPAYENKITDEDIWHMVNYMRTFKK